MDYIALNIKFLRTVAGLSQEELAQKVELNRGNITSYERGAAKPNINTIKRIAAFFNTDLEKLVQTDMSKTLSLEELQDLYSKGKGFDAVSKNAEKKKQANSEKGKQSIDVQFLLKELASHQASRESRFYTDISSIAGSVNKISGLLEQLADYYKKS